MNIHTHPGRLLAGTAVLLAICCSPASRLQAQQTEVDRYDIFTGFTSLNAPALGLSQPGFHVQAGVTPRSWYSAGFDYSVGTGTEIVKPGLLPANLQAAVLGAEQQYIAAGLLPANYQLGIEADVFTQTFAAGPQLTFRHFTKATFFVRPSLGALRERATPHPADPFAAVIAGQLAPKGYKTDWTGFYGVGGGVDYMITRHIGIRGQMDIVYNHPFNDILANGRWTERYSVGPSFHFGRNILAKPAALHAAHAGQVPPDHSTASSSSSSSLGTR